MKLKDLFTAVLVVSVVIGCTNDQSTGINNSGGESKYSLLQSDRARIIIPSVTSGQVENIVNGNNQFGFELMEEISKNKSGKNILLSPFSIYAAFGMTYAGARNATEEEMAKILHFTNQNEFHREFNALEQSLSSLNSNNNKLSINNSIWCQQNYHIESPFLDLMAEEYGTGIFSVDFGMSEIARKAINGWVEEKTDKLIVNLLPENSLDGSTRMVLVNTVYLNALWENQFDKNMTAKKPFNSGDKQITADFMSTGAPVDMNYINNDTITAVEIKYKESNLVMDLVMPKNGMSISGISAETFTSIVQSMSNGKVFLSMPKLSLKPGTFSLKELFIALGMVNAFTFSSDFSGMTGSTGLCIGDAYHQVTLDVFETGTIAAAATAVIMIEKSMPIAESLTFDHPFILSIRDRFTGAILFLGTIQNPAE